MFSMHLQTTLVTLIGRLFQANFLFPDILASFHSSGILEVFINVSNIFCNGRQIFSHNSISNLAPISSGSGDLLILSSFNVSNIMFSAHPSLIYCLLWV